MKLFADLAPLYQHLCSELGWTLDSSKLAEMQAANTLKLAELDDKQKDAEENLGETEVRDVMLARAEYLGSIGDREAASQAFDAVEKKTASGGNKVDLLFSQIRCLGVPAFTEVVLVGVMLTSHVWLMPTWSRAADRPHLM